MRRCLFLLLLLLPSLFAQDHTPQIIDIAAPRIVDVDLRNLPTPAAWQPGDGLGEVPRGSHSQARGPLNPQRQADPLAQQQRQLAMRTQLRAFATPDLNIDAQDFTGSTPADPVGAVGQNFYIQAVNFREGTNNFTTSYAVYDKQTGDLVAGPFLLEDLGSGACASGKGDPIILYDQLANRWLLSEFSENGLDTICIYISRTSDPITGGWFNYSFEAPEFPDYPKYGLHPDAYFVSSEESQPAVWALDRQSMLAGQSASFIRFVTQGLDGFTFDPLTPADLDGAQTPLAGTPGFYLRHNDDEMHEVSPDPSRDFLEIYAFVPDFLNTSNANFTGPFRIPVSEFDSELCSATPLRCIPQPDGEVPQDAIAEVIMHRLAYRVFDTHETLVGAFTVDIDGNDFAGIRWFELRKALGAPVTAWALHQEGTYTLDDGLHRWLPSIAMDQSGHMAMGFRASSSTAFPSLRYVGRLASDPLGVMTQGEHLLVTSTASNAFIRNGDYAAMTVDPVDDCAFWFTAEYFPDGNWQTRLASFSYDICGCTPPEAPQNVVATATPGQDHSVTVNWDAASGAARYDVYRTQGDCDALSATLVAQGISATSFVDTTPSGGIAYGYQVQAFSADDCPSTLSACASATPTGDCTIAPDFAGLVSLAAADGNACQFELNWQAATSTCGTAQDLRYNVYRSDQEDFAPSVQTLLASCLDATTYSDNLLQDGQTFYYIVRAEDLSAAGSGPCGGLEDDNLVVLGDTITGTPLVQFEEDWENGDDAFVFEALPFDTSQRGWGLNNLDATSGQFSIFVAFSERETDQVFYLAEALLIGSTWELNFMHRFETETGIDGGVLEYTIDGGSNWQDITEGVGAIPANPNRFLATAYNGSINSNAGTPLANRDAYTGTQAWQQTRIDLSDFSGETVNFRWRAVGDAFNGSTGWRIDDIALIQRQTCDSSCVASELYADWRQSPNVPDIRNIIICIE